MQFYQPHVHLYVEPSADGPDEYFLHAVTLCTNTCYRAAGHLDIPTALDDDGAWVIGLKIQEDPGLPDFQSLTPIVHTIGLGSVPGGAQHVPVKVHLWIETPGQELEQDGPKATSTVSTTSASQPSRPIF